MNNINGIVLIGPPGSGKSTIGRRIARSLNMIYVSSGDIARHMAVYNTEVQTRLDNGELAPEDEMRGKVYNALYRINARGDEFVLDGFPRNVDQLSWLISRFPSIVVIHMDASLTNCMSRLLKRGRPDDIRFIIDERFAYYDEHTRPILESLPAHIPHHVIPDCEDINEMIGMTISKILGVLHGTEDQQL